MICTLVAFQLQDLRDKLSLDPPEGIDEEAAPKITMIEQIIKPSVSDEDKRSHVTTPPIRIPGIQVGKGSVGNRNISVPGIGTPMVTPIKVLIARIQIDSLSVQSKLLAHGAFSRNK